MKKVWFMFLKFLTDMRRLREKGYDLADDVNSGFLGYYYFLFDEGRVASGKDQKLISRFDENGIPINKTYVDIVDKDFVYFPISIGQMGLSVFHTYLKSKSEKDKLRFLKFAEWFVNNATISEELGAVWYTDVDLPAYQRKAPWQSAFSQSRGISILLRAYQDTGIPKFKEVATLALKPFTKSVKDGGVTITTPFGPFYEEYTSSEPTMVLNGKIFALCGIWDYHRLFPDNIECKLIWDEGVSTLISILPQFDLGYWSRYNICKADWYPEVDPATIGYQKLHITQFLLMYKITGQMIFKEYAELFKSQISLKNILKMYRVKSKALRKIGRL